MKLTSVLRTALRKDLLLTAPFLLLFFVQLAHHALWLDELNVFGMAAANSTIASLFHIIHYEGHPWIWYWLVWIVARFTDSPVGLKVLEGIIGTGVYLVIGVFSPFLRWEKVLLFLSYFINFEYTVMSRMYGLLLLWLLLYLHDRTQHPDRLLVKGLLLGLMCSTDAMGWILCGGLIVEMAVYQLLKCREETRPSRIELLQAICIWAPITAFAYWTMKLNPDVSWRTTGHMLRWLHDMHHLRLTIMRYIVVPYTPMRMSWDGLFWQQAYPPFVVHVALLALILFTYVWIFRKDLNLLAHVAGVTLGCIAFGQLIISGSVRHFGITFLAFVSACWILRAKRTRLPVLACVLLGISAVSGMWVNVLEWRRPFSNAETAVAWLREHHLENEPMAGSPDTTAVSIPILLHRSMYFLDCNCSDSFVLYSSRRDDFSITEIPDRMGQAMTKLHATELLFFGDVPLTPEQLQMLTARRLHASLVAQFPGSQNEYGDYYVYRVTVANRPDHS